MTPFTDRQGVTQVRRVHFNAAIVAEMTNDARSILRRMAAEGTV